MKVSKNKARISTIALILILCFASSLFTLPTIYAQDLEMNLPGDVEPYNIEIHQSIDIDLNGGPGPFSEVELWVKYPGRTDFTYIDTYTTRDNGDLDVYDFDFNETGEFQLKWMVGTDSSNIGIVQAFLPGEVPIMLAELKTYIYVVPQPAAGVGQQMFIVYWVDRMPRPETDEEIAAGLRGAYTGVTLTITKPDATTETIDMPRSDPVGGGYTLYTPTQTGTYSVVANFPGNWRNSTTEYVATWYLPSESVAATFEVQQEPVPGWSEAPVTSDYWRRPISGPSHSWSVLAGNWLGSYANVHPQGAYGGTSDNYGWGAAPGSAHILWTRQFTPSGSLIDERFGPDVYTLNHYQDVSYNQLVVDGGIYYTPAYTQHGSMGWAGVNLYTGEQLFFDYETRAPAFAQIYTYHSGNQHGGFSYFWRTSGVTLPERVEIAHAELTAPGAQPPRRISRSSTVNSEDLSRTGRLWEMIDAYTRQTVCYIANVSTGGEMVYGKDGSILYYDTDNLGTSSDPDYRLTVWNSSAGTMVASQNGTGYWQWRPGGGGGFGASLNYFGGLSYNNVHDGNLFWSLNVSIPDIQGADIEVVRQGEYVIFATSGSNDERGVVPAQLMAVSLEPGHEGEKLWESTITPPQDSVDDYQGVNFRSIYPEDEVVVYRYENKLKWYVYDMKTGAKLWESEPENAFHYYGMVDNYYAGMLLTSGNVAGGVLRAYDIRTGDIIWKYIAEGAGTESPYGNSIFRGELIADGKIYLSSWEHSGSSPLWRGPNLRCLNATTGEEIWKILFWGESSTSLAVADGILTGFNWYDGQVYAFGRGPSATTVTAPDTEVALGDSVVIKGTVTDQTPTGRRDNKNEVQFTLKDTPAISDEDMQKWMEYMFMGQAYPSMAKGVEVVLSVYDTNNNYYEIGRTTSDATGFYSFTWKPPIPGDYTIIANFEGSASYGPSEANTALYVNEAPSAPGYQGPSADQIAQATINRLPPYPTMPDVPTAAEVAQETVSQMPPYPEMPTMPDVPTATEVAQETVNQMPETPETPAYLTIDLVILVVAAIGVIIGLLAYMTLRRQ